MGWQWPSEKIKKFSSFLLFEEKLIPHGVPDIDFNPVCISGKEHDQENFLLLLRYYVEKFIEALNKKEFDISAVFAGILGHIIQECFFPSHTIPNKYFYEFVSRPKNLFPQFHNLIDSVNIVPEKANPFLLGTSPEEISFRLWVEMEKQIIWCKKNLQRIIDAIVKKNEKEIKKLMYPSCKKAADILSSVWYSSICFAAGKFKKREMKKLKEISLTELTPYFCHPGGEYIYPGNYSIYKGKRKPLYVIEGGKRRYVRNGLGISSFVSLKYLIDTKVFPRFECNVGISPFGLNEKIKNTGVKFIIEIDENVNKEYRPDLSYKKTKILFKKELVVGKLLKINVSIKGAKTIIISALPFPVNINGEEKYLFPNIVIEKPILRKI